MSFDLPDGMETHVESHKLVTANIPFGNRWWSGTIPAITTLQIDWTIPNDGFLYSLTHAFWVLWVFGYCTVSLRQNDDYLFAGREICSVKWTPGNRHQPMLIAGDIISMYISNSYGVAYIGIVLLNLYKWR